MKIKENLRLNFSDLGLDNQLLEAVKRTGFEEPTPIQAKTIPLVLSGIDVIGQAQTGTGKTAAFGLPLLQKIDYSRREIQALVISPTRELAIQTQEEIFKLGKEKLAKVQAVFGGANIVRQIKQLKNYPPHILVGTPGRLLDHLQRGTVNLSKVETLVLDEADEMLDMGFLDDISKIIAQISKKRQTLLFSATMPPAILKVGKRFMNHPEIVKIKNQQLTADLVDQFFVKVRENEKFDVMTRILDVQAPELTIVFGRTKRRVDELSRGLVARGYNAAGIHGDLSQQQRSAVLKKFRDGDLDILVATDVAARGLDISGVSHVYNYDIPQDPESYVHRIGRTGRAGHQGISVTFVTPNEMDYLRVIEKLTRKRMIPMRPPTAKEAFNGQMESAIREIDNLISRTDTDKYSDQANELLNEYSALDLAAALLNTVSREDASSVPVKITPERPLPRRKRANRHDNRYGKNRKRNYRDRRGKRKDQRPKKKQTTKPKYKIRKR